MLSTSSSGTSSPRSMIGLAWSPRGVPRPTWSRNMSPVERCGTPNCSAICFACVPFPAPGGPKKITARPSPVAGPARGIATAPQPPLFDKAFVVTHDQLRLNLLHRIHGHANHDQQRRAAEVKINVQPLQHKPPHVVVNPGPQRSG